MSLAVFLKSLFTGQEPWDTFCIISGQLLVAGIPSTAPRHGARGEKCACAGSASRQPGVPPPPCSPAGRAQRGEVGRGAERWRSRGRRKSRGIRLVMRSRRARGKSERAARLLLLLEAAAAAAPPDGSDRKSVV